MTRQPPVYNDIPALVDGCYDSLTALEVKGNFRGRDYHYCRPALKKYHAGQWLWDSGWHTVVWSHRAPENAVAELRTLLSYQQPDGFVPEIIFWKANWFARYIFNPLSGFSHPDYTYLTQMPMLAYSVRAIWNATGDKSLLEEFVPKIAAYLTWWEIRDLDDAGLVSIIHPWESGIDASPVYDPVFHLDDPKWYQLYPRFWNLLVRYRRLRWDQTGILKREWFDIKDVGVCSVYADGWSILADLAVKFDTTLAARCRAKAVKYRDGIIEKCWDRKSGRFISLFRQNGRYNISGAETVQALLPLLLDDLPADIAAKLVSRLTDPKKFWLNYPVPSVAADDPSFTAGASRLLWRGPMWPATTWLVMEGLLKHGFKTEARTILDRWTEMCLKNGVWEYYHPLTGEGLGQKDMGMSTLIVDMLRRFNLTP